MPSNAGARARPASVADLRALAGRELGPTQWIAVEQELIDAFAQVTGDHQWIHVDAERAGESAFGGTIAHGLFTLSLGPKLTAELVSFEGFSHALNYGYERIRFPAPLPTGARVRMRAVVAEVREAPGAATVVLDQTFEREGADKPVCVAQALSRFSFA